MAQNVVRRGLKPVPRDTATALCFTTALVLFETLIFRFHRRYIDLYHYTSSLGPFWIVVGGVLVFLGFALTALYIWSSLRASPRTRCVYFAVFTAIVFLQYGYMGALKGFATADDLLLAAWGTSVFQKRSMALSYLTWTAAIPSVAYGLLLWRVGRGKDGPARLAATLAVMTLVAAPSISLLAQRRLSVIAAYPAPSVSEFFRSVAEAIWRSQALLSGEREPVPYQHSGRPDLNIVLVVDESVRADRLSLNGHERRTTPFLEGLEREGRLTNWGLAVAGANCSVGSNRLLWTGVPTDLLPATRGEVSTWPSLMQYAKALGYRTFYFDAQSDRFWIGSGVELRYIDHWMVRRDFGDAAEHEVDFLIADRVARIVDSSRGNFIWVNKRGVHPPYFEAFPPDEAIWTPYARVFRAPHTVERRALLNAYDNAIRYNVDGFFRHLDIRARPRGTLVFYTSDHGQSLSERGEAVYHCSDRRSVDRADREALVPLLLAVAGGRARDPGPWRNRASHQNLFTTILDAMKVPERARVGRYAPSLYGDVPDRWIRRYYLGNWVEGDSPAGALVTFAE